MARTRNIRRRVRAGAAALAVVASALPARAQTALVIGNSAYAVPPALPACEPSANLAAAALGRAGFKVTQLVNPSNARMGAAISALGDEGGGGPLSRVAIYYCGAVASYGDRLFLLPVETRLERDSDLLTQGIVARLLLASAAAGSAAGAGLVLMDVAARGPAGPLVPGAAIDAMIRPADLAHVGLAAAQIAVASNQFTAPLATAIGDLLRQPRVELGQTLADLPANPVFARMAPLAIRPPAAPALLVGQAAGAVPPAAPSVAPAPAVPPPAARPPAASVPAALPPSAGVEPALADPSPADRRRIQVALNRLAYFRGTIDGVFGPATEAAIRLFQRDSREEATGRLTAAQMSRLLDH